MLVTDAANLGSNSIDRQILQTQGRARGDRVQRL